MRGLGFEFWFVDFGFERCEVVSADVVDHFCFFQFVIVAVGRFVCVSCDNLSNEDCVVACRELAVESAF